MRLFNNRVLAVGQRKRSARKTPDVAKGEHSFAGPDGAFRAERGALARACPEKLPAKAGRVVTIVISMRNLLKGFKGSPTTHRAGSASGGCFHRATSTPRLATP